jgi:hypothetical protein
MPPQYSLPSCCQKLSVADTDIACGYHREGSKQFVDFDGISFGTRLFFAVLFVTGNLPQKSPDQSAPNFENIMIHATAMPLNATSVDNGIGCIWNFNPHVRCILPCLQLPISIGIS